MFPSSNSGEAGVILRIGVLMAMVAAGACAGHAQAKRVWVLQKPDAMVEYDPTTFAPKQTVTVPAGALQSPTALQVNARGQMLFELDGDDPMIDASKGMADKVWFWDGQKTATMGRSFTHIVSNTGSNQKVTESLPAAYLSTSGTNLYWFTNDLNKLERDNVDLDVSTTFRAWRSDLAGKQREDVASFEIPSCRCTTGACPETCSEARVWVPEGGVSGYFLVTRVVPGQTEPKFESTSLYEPSGGSWTGAPLAEPLEKILDANEDASFVVNAVPDIGCCGWENQSNDQTVLYRFGKKVVLFDERERYKNPNYDVSFFTSNAKIAPNLSAVAMTVEATAKPDSPIQLAEQGQANPPESARLRKALAELPAALVVNADGTKQIAYLPHTRVAGWLNENELLIVEGGMLVVYTPATGAKKKTAVKVEQKEWVYVR
jgi:hypothetical protein